MGKAERAHRESSAPTSLLNQGYPRACGTELWPDSSREGKLHNLWATGAHACSGGTSVHHCNNCILCILLFNIKKRQNFS